LAYFKSGYPREAEKSIDRAKEYAKDRDLVDYYSQIRDRISENTFKYN
jgi:hypothetical protein